MTPRTQNETQDALHTQATYEKSVMSGGVLAAPFAVDTRKHPPTLLSVAKGHPLLRQPVAIFGIETSSAASNAPLPQHAAADTPAAPRAMAYARPVVRVAPVAYGCRDGVVGGG